MKIYQNSTGGFFELLYIQNERNPKGGATPAVEPTHWFLPIQVKRQGRIPVGFERVPGALPVGIPENLASRFMSEFTGRIGDLPSDTPTKAEPAPKQKGAEE